MQTTRSHILLIALTIGALRAQTGQPLSSPAAGESAHAPAVAFHYSMPAGFLYSAREPFPFAGRQTPQGRTAPAPVSQPVKAGPGWARRHLLLLSGLALTGAGAALVAGGGPGQASGCLAAGPYGATECTTVSTWGASGRHIGGILLLGAGVPMAIFGIFKHP